MPLRGHRAEAVRYTFPTGITDQEGIDQHRATARAILKPADNPGVIGLIIGHGGVDEGQGPAVRDAPDLGRDIPGDGAVQKRQRAAVRDAPDIERVRTVTDDRAVEHEHDAHVQEAADVVHSILGDRGVHDGHCALEGSRTEVGVVAIDDGAGVCAVAGV
jgi:hypothetical protein